MAIIHTYQAGFCSHPECMVIKGGRLQICQFPAKVFLLQVNDRLWLWDTGYSEHFFDATRGIYQLYRRITPVTFDPSDAIVNQLASDGIAISDLAGLILSHYHADHIAGIKDFVRPQSHNPLSKYDIHIIASKQGWDKLAPLTGIKALKQGFLPDLIPNDMSQYLQFIEHFEQTILPAELAPFDKGYILPDSNGEIILVELAGHAHGHFGAFVQTNRSDLDSAEQSFEHSRGQAYSPQTAWTLIASDSAWLPQNYQTNTMPSVVANTIMANVGQYQHTLLKLHKLSINQPNLPILLSHS